MNNKEFGIELLNYFFKYYCDCFDDIDSDGEEVLTYTFDNDNAEEIVERFLIKISD